MLNQRAFIGVVLAVCSHFGSNVDGFCEVPRPSSLLDDRIYGGVKASILDFPWMAALKLIIYPTSLASPVDCSGFILNEEWILTAAHCTTLPRSIEEGRVLGFNIRVGQDRFLDSSTSIKRNSSKFFVHPKYKRLLSGHDFALIKLDKPLSFSSTVNKLCLPHSAMCDTTVDPKLNSVDSCTELQVAGWGKTKSSATSVHNLMKVSLSVVSNENCENAARILGSRYTVKSSQFCAVGNSHGQDTCVGDSGGPLVCVKGHQIFAIGVVSFGFSGDKCGIADLPAVYGRICDVLPWIQETMRNNGNLSNFNPVVKCSKLTINNGQVLGNSTKNGDSLSIVCDHGYHLEGADETFCLNGKWMSVGKCTLDAACEVPRLVHLLNDRIHGVGDGSILDFPWTAALQFVIFEGSSRKPSPIYPGSANCGGFIIDEEWILTAAQCAVHRWSSDSKIGFTIRVGQDKLLDNSSVTERKSSKIVVHPKYQKSIFEHDFALIKLDKPLSFSSTINKICLPYKSMCDTTVDPKLNSIDSCKGLLGAGWGTSGARELQKFWVNVLSNENCENAAKNFYKETTVKSSQFCADNSCVPLAGHPLLCVKDRQIFAVGVVSSQFTNCETEGAPGINGRICDVLPWIQETMRTN